MQLCIFVRIGCLAVLPLEAFNDGILYTVALGNGTPNGTEIIRKKCGIMQRLCTVAMGREQ